MAPKTARKASQAKKTSSIVKRSVKAANPKDPKKKASEKTRAAKGMPETLRDTAIKVLDARKAEDIVLLDVRGRSPLLDYMIVASGSSARQLAALAEYLREAFFKLGQRRVKVEGAEQGDWVLVDGGDVLIHLFRPEVRAYYKVEDLWKRKR